jgi:hypothetical protein
LYLYWIDVSAAVLLSQENVKWKGWSLATIWIFNITLQQLSVQSVDMVTRDETQQALLRMHSPMSTMSLFLRVTNITPRGVLPFTPPIHHKTKPL